MRGTDRYLIIFAAGVVVLIIVGLAVAAIQPDRTYLDGDGPEAVAHNYLLAIEQHDYERAYSYLSPDLVGYPQDTHDFVRQIRNYEWEFPTADNTTALTLLAVEAENGWAEADVRMTVNYGGGILGFSRRTEEFQLNLEHTDDGWKIVSGRRLFLYCWASGDCR